MATVAYPFCSYCVASRPCTYVRTTSPPWPITGSPVPVAAWEPEPGTTQGPTVEGWVRFTGTQGEAQVGMVALVSTPIGATVDFHFTARSDFARDIRRLPLARSDLVATPNLTFYPEAQRYHLRFVATVDNALDLASLQPTGGAENFEVADDMTYTVTLPLASASDSAPAPTTYATEHRQTRGSRGRFIRR